MATHYSTLAWKIPRTEEPGKLQSMGSLRVGYDWVTSLSLFTFMHWRRKWQPTPVFLPGESQGWGSLVGCRLWGCRVGHHWSNLAVAAAAANEVDQTVAYYTEWSKSDVRLSGRRGGWDDLREQHWNMYITICDIDRQSRSYAWDRALRFTALGQPWEMGWGGREVGGGFRMGATCLLMVDSCQCMAKTTTIL